MNKSKEISKALETAIEAKTNAERKGADAEEKYNALFILHEEV